MRVAHYAGDATIAVAEADPVPPGPGDVQIAVAFTGICGTDLHIRHGSMDARVRVPVVLGHEMSGRIAAVGAEVSRWRVGDPVTVMPLRWCDSCPTCRAGHPHICQRLDLIRVPDGMSLRDAALVEPTAVAVHDVARAGVAADEPAVVVGGGPVGVLIACVARSAGTHVVVVEPNPYRRLLAQELGLAVLDPSRTDVEGRIQDRTGGAGVAVAFEVSGTRSGLATALSVLGPRGRMVAVGIHPMPQMIDMQRMFLRELSLLGARVYERSDFERAVQLIADGTVPAGRPVSRVEPLGSAVEAFTALESGDGVMKVLVDCRGGGG
jgi:2-desacetyl-2-hydroxyethyl bacteriochlorophyllide A dehydrogenase